MAEMKMSAKKTSVKVFEDITKVRSKMEQETFEGIKILFPVSTDFSFYLPSSIDSVVNISEKNALAVYCDHFLHGGKMLEKVLKLLGKGGGHVEDSLQALLDLPFVGASGASSSEAQKEKKKRASRRKKDPTEQAVGEEVEGGTQESQTVAKPKLNP
ncbi:hypothetical protein Dimus_020822 [Dionaea muscipula]